MDRKPVRGDRCDSLFPCSMLRRMLNLFSPELAQGSTGFVFFTLCAAWGRMPETEPVFSMKSRPVPVLGEPWLGKASPDCLHESVRFTLLLPKRKRHVS